MLESALAELEDPVQLKHMHDQLEALQRLAKRARASLADQNRIAEFRIRCARKAGQILSATVSRGGKSNSHGGCSNPLPEGISWNQSSRWQKLARIEDESLQDYFDTAASDELEVTVAGAFRAAKADNLAKTHFSSQSPEWYTPAHVLDAVVAVLGGIDLDPCADSGRQVPAVRHYTESDDGLSRVWSGRVFMNPPYGSSLPRWVEKLQDSFEAGSVASAVSLVPSRTDTAWFQVLREHPRCFIRGRLKFSGSKNAAPFPSMCVYLGPSVERFVQVFRALGDCYRLVESDSDHE